MRVVVFGSGFWASKDQFQDIVQACPSTALLIYQYLVNSECKRIQSGQNPLEHRSGIRSFPFLSRFIQDNPLENANQLPADKARDPTHHAPEMEFLEIDIEKRVEKLKEENQSSNPLAFEQFRLKNDIAPLYTHEIFKKKMEMKGSAPMEKPKAQGKKQENNQQGSIFLVEKLEKQIQEARQKKLEMKLAKKNTGGGQRKLNDSFQKSFREGGIDEV